MTPNWLDKIMEASDPVGFVLIVTAMASFAAILFFVFEDIVIWIVRRYELWEFRRGWRR